MAPQQPSPNPSPHPSKSSRFVCSSNRPSLRKKHSLIPTKESWTASKGYIKMRASGHITKETWRMWSGTSQHRLSTSPSKTSTPKHSPTTSPRPPSGKDCSPMQFTAVLQAPPRNSLSTHSITSGRGWPTTYRWWRQAVRDSSMEFWIAEERR